MSVCSVYVCVNNTDGEVSAGGLEEFTESQCLCVVFICVLTIQMVK